MKQVQIDGLMLNETMVTELTKWYASTVDSYPEHFMAYLEHSKNTLIRLLCEDNEKYDADIKESLSGIILMQDSLKNLLPTKYEQQ